MFSSIFSIQYSIFSLGVQLVSRQFTKKVYYNHADRFIFDPTYHTMQSGIVYYSSYYKNILSNLSSILFHQIRDSWRVFLFLSVSLQMISWLLVIYWYCFHWHNHPICRTLKAHAQLPYSTSGHIHVAASINREFRRIDKVVIGEPGAGVIVTDNWILKVSVKKRSLQSQ